MSIQPQELAEDVFHRLHICSKDPDAVSEFDLRRLKNDATKLIDYNAMAGYTALGCIGFLMHDTNSMYENHQRALNLGPHDFHSNINFAVSLTNTGRYRECCEYSLNAVRVSGKDDVFLLQQHCEHLTSAGRFLDAYEYASKLIDMKVEPRHLDFINAATRQMEDQELDQELVSDYLCAVTDIMTKHDVYPSGEAMWDAYDESYQLIREVFIDVEPEEAAQMNSELSKLVISKNLPEKILANFSSSFTAGKLPNKTSESHGYKV